MDPPIHGRFIRENLEDIVQIQYITSKAQMADILFFRENFQEVCDKLDMHSIFLFLWSGSFFSACCFTPVHSIYAFYSLQDFELVMYPNPGCLILHLDYK